MASYKLTLAAQDEIDGEADRIDNDDAATRWIDDIHDALETLGRNPGIGHRRADLTSHDVHFWKFRKWAIIYRKDTPITVADSELFLGHG